MKICYKCASISPLVSNFGMCTFIGPIYEALQMSPIRSRCGPRHCSKSFLRHLWDKRGISQQLKRSARQMLCLSLLAIKMSLWIAPLHILNSPNYVQYWLMVIVIVPLCSCKRRNSEKLTGCIESPWSNKSSVKIERLKHKKVYTSFFLCQTM